MRLIWNRIASWFESQGVRGSVPPSPPPYYVPSNSGGTGRTDGDGVSGLVGLQVLGTAIGLGVLTNSWFVFGIALLGFFWLFDRPSIAMILGVLYSVGLGIVAGVIAFSQFQRFDAGIVCGFIAFFIVLSLNREHVRRLRW